YPTIETSRTQAPYCVLPRDRTTIGETKKLTAAEKTNVVQFETMLRAICRRLERPAFIAASRPPGCDHGSDRQRPPRIDRPGRHQPRRCRLAPAPAAALRRKRSKSRCCVACGGDGIPR